MHDDYRSAFQTIGVDLSERQLTDLSYYAERLKIVNRSTNLTAVDDDSGILWRHFIDSCQALRHIELDPSRQIVDIGTGAGFPGLPLAIVSGAQTTLLDALQKRVRFLKDVVNGLGLAHVVVEHGRAEQFGQTATHRAKFDYAFARAVTALPVLIEYAVPFLKVGGYFIAYKSADIADEISASSAALQQLNSKITEIYEYTDNLNIKRKLVVVEKLMATPPKFPRRVGLPGKRPLK